MTRDLYPNTTSYLWLVNIWVVDYFLNCVTKISDFIDDKEYKTYDYYFSQYFALIIALKIIPMVFALSINQFQLGPPFYERNIYNLSWYKVCALSNALEDESQKY